MDFFFENFLYSRFQLVVVLVLISVTLSVADAVVP
jgi:hypothetical protein